MPVLAVFMSGRDVPPLVCEEPRGGSRRTTSPITQRWRSQRRTATPPGSNGPQAPFWPRRAGEAGHPRGGGPRPRGNSRASLASAPAPRRNSERGRHPFAAAEETSLEEAPAAAERLGYPLVAKVQAEGVVHKSDVGGVLPGLQSKNDVEEAAVTLRERMEAIGVDLKHILLQREIRNGIEALVGVSADPVFGPMLVCGLGGVLVEVIKDTSFRLPPVSDTDAEEMIARLRTGTLLNGYRGAPAGDRNALIDVIRRVSALTELIPELQELDLNPSRCWRPAAGCRRGCPHEDLAPRALTVLVPETHDCCNGSLTRTWTSASTST